MASLLEFRRAVSAYAQVSIYGFFQKETVGFLPDLGGIDAGASPRVEEHYKDTALAFRDDDLVGVNRKDPRTGGPGLAWGLRAGSKHHQMRVNVNQEDTFSDASVSSIIADISIIVYRVLNGDEEENNYVNLEMLENQAELLSHSGWLSVFNEFDVTDTPVIDELTESPRIDAEPVRIGPVMQYQVDLQARVRAD